MNAEQIKYMVNRFLSWRLPENFNPDGGISFELIANKGTEREFNREPVGTLGGSATDQPKPYTAQKLDKIKDAIRRAASPVERAAPIHPFEVRISIGGEDWEYVRRSMATLAEQIQKRDPDHCGGFSGGGGGSWSLTVAQRDVTPEQFRKELADWHQNSTPFSLQARDKRRSK